MRSGQYSPLRYPGGKGKLAALIKAIISENGLLDGTYVEPFAGGAGVACELLAENYVREIHINDVSPAIYSFWKAALWDDDRFCRDIETIPLTVDEWDRQKQIFELHRRNDGSDLYELGFSTFYLNRTNRSGILNAGIIGGRSQSSEWGIDARFNRDELVKRIRLLSSMSDRIKVTRLDALSLIKQYGVETPFRTLMYLDPPYFVKGRQLYLDYYKPSDHSAIAEAVQAKSQPFNWMVSYDNVEPIKRLYPSPYTIEYDINYSARSASTGSEVIFFDRALKLPRFEDFIKVTNAVA